MNEGNETIKMDAPFKPPQNPALFELRTASTEQERTVQTANLLGTSVIKPVETRTTAVIDIKPAHLIALIVGVLALYFWY